MNRYLKFQAFVEHIIAENATSNLYFLLDHGGLPGLHKQLQNTSVSWVSLFNGTNESNLLEVAPILVVASFEGAAKIPIGLFNWLNEHGTYSSSVIILLSPLGIGQLKIELVKRLNICLPDNVSAMLRYFDPRVFEALVDVLDVEQARIFLGAAERWWYVDRGGTIRTVESKFNDAAMVEEPMVLSLTQELGLIDHCEADQVLKLLRDGAPNLIRKIELQSQFYFVNTNIGEAKDVGLQSIDDLVLYNVVVMEMKGRLVNERKWESFMSAVKSEPSKFADFVLDVQSYLTNGEST